MKIDLETASLVTGGGKRIGREIALMLAGLGAPVVVHCQTSLADAEKTAADCAALGVHAAVIRGDLTDANVAGGLVEAAVSAIGAPIGRVVNNASVFENDKAVSFAAEDFDRNMALHARAPALIARAMAAQSPALASGAIVNMLDRKSFGTDRGFFSYSASKYALLGLTRQLAAELAPSIRVNGVALGMTLPPPNMTAERFLEFQNAAPLGPGVGPADAAAAVQFLFEAPAITGEIIIIDGGEHLGSAKRF